MHCAHHKTLIRCPRPLLPSTTGSHCPRLPTSLSCCHVVTLHLCCWYLPQPIAVPLYCLSPRADEYVPLRKRREAEESRLIRLLRVGVVASVQGKASGHAWGSMLRRLNRGIAPLTL